MSAKMYRARCFFGDRLVYWEGSAPLWGWHPWIGGRMFCVGRWTLYFGETQ